MQHSACLRDKLLLEASSPPPHMSSGQFQTRGPLRSLETRVDTAFEPAHSKEFPVFHLADQVGTSELLLNRTRVARDRGL